MRFSAALELPQRATSLMRFLLAPLAVALVHQPLLQARLPGAARAAAARLAVASPSELRAPARPLVVSADDALPLRIDGQWYDLGDWADDHPGGRWLLECARGRDVTVYDRARVPAHPHSHRRGCGHPPLPRTR